MKKFAPLALIAMATLAAGAPSRNEGVERLTGPIEPEPGCIRGLGDLQGGTLICHGYSQ